MVCRCSSAISSLVFSVLRLTPGIAVIHCCYYITAWVEDAFGIVQFKEFLSFTLTERRSERALTGSFRCWMRSAVRCHRMSEYILALKITPGRQKDLDDCAILLPKTNFLTL